METFYILSYFVIIQIFLYLKKAPIGPLLIEVLIMKNLPFRIISSKLIIHYGCLNLCVFCTPEPIYKVTRVKHSNVIANQELDVNA